jgi:hypothetical protein
MGSLYKNMSIGKIKVISRNKNNEIIPESKLLRNNSDAVLPNFLEERKGPNIIIIAPRGATVAHLKEVAPGALLPAI